MSSKRKQPDSEGDEAVHASRQFQVYGNNPKPAKKPRRAEPVYKKQAHASSVNAIKKRIRDISRKLERAEDLPANVRMEDERALAAYKQELAAAETEKFRQKMIAKYHMVRFFERQKATRQLKKLRKRLLETQSTDEVEALKKDMHVAEVDLNYTQFCPLMEPYISLYPQKSAYEEGSTPASSIPKPPLWSEVEKCMGEGTLERLRNRIVNAPAIASRLPERRPAKAKAKTAPAPAPASAPAPVDTSGMNRRERRAQRNQRGVGERGSMKNKSMAFAMNQAFGAEQGTRRDKAGIEQDDGASDGGFFEE